MAKDLTNQELKSRLLDCLGGDRPPPGDPALQLGASTAEKGYRRVSISYSAEAGEQVPAWLLLPDVVSPDQPGPAIAVWHQHNNEWELGKSEPAGLAGDPRQQVGPPLARAGYVVLCPDAAGFEDRQDDTGVLSGDAFERFLFLRYVVEGKSLAWKNVLDMRRAIDALEHVPEVDSRRIGCFGHSMGSTFTWLLGPFEPRLRCLVANCCLPTYAAIHREHLLHCYSNFVPGWLQYGDTPDIAALTAPRPLWMNFGENDPGSPIDEVRKGVETIQTSYLAHGVPEQFGSYIEAGAGHELSENMWRHSLNWFDKHLI